MTNPFKGLGRTKIEDPQGEEVEGAFSCQERGCYDVSKTARYLAEVGVLTWKCKEEHISKLEEFKLD